MRMARTVAGPRATVPGAAGKSERACWAVGATTPLPASLRYVVATTRDDAPGEAFSAATTCAAVDVTALPAFVASETVMVAPTTPTESGEFATPGATSASWTLLPPSCP